MRYLDYMLICPFVRLFVWTFVYSFVYTALTRFESLVLRTLHLFLAAPQIVRLLSKAVCSLSTKPQVSTKLYYTITVCCTRTAHS